MKYLWNRPNVLRIKLELWLGMGYRVISNSRQSFVEGVEGSRFIPRELMLFFLVSSSMSTSWFEGRRTLAAPETKLTRFMWNF